MEPKLTGYITAKGSAIQNATKEIIGNAQVAGGIRAEGDYGLFGQVEVGYGNAFQIEGEAGKIFNFNDNFELTTSFGWQYLKSNTEFNYYKKKFGEKGNSPTWKPYDIRGFANAGVNFKGDWGEVGIGVQGGIKNSEKPELPPDGLDETIGTTKGTDITGSHTKMYITPTVHSKINLGGNFSLNLNAALDQGSIGLAWNF